MGPSRTEYGGNSLPLDMAPFGMPGCTLLEDLALQLATPTQPLAGGQAQAAMPIPNLIGGSNPGGVVVSNALAVQIGG